VRLAGEAAARVLGGNDDRRSDGGDAGDLLDCRDAVRDACLSTTTAVNERRWQSVVQWVHHRAEAIVFVAEELARLQSLSSDDLMGLCNRGGSPLREFRRAYGQG
jgi:hypothetical protein